MIKQTDQMRSMDLLSSENDDEQVEAEYSDIAINHMIKEKERQCYETPQQSEEAGESKFSK